MIEKYTANIQTVHTPPQWYDHVRDAVMKVGSKIEVVEMEQENFQNYREHLRKLYTECNKETDNHPLDFANAVWFNFGRGEKVVDGKLAILEHSSDVWIRHTYDVGETPVCII